MTFLNETNPLLRRDLKSKIVIPENWDSREGEAKEAVKYREIQEIEDRIKIIEDIIFPVDKNSSIAIPKGMSEKEFENLEKEYNTLIPKLKKLLGDKLI